MANWSEQFFHAEWNAIESRLHASAVSGDLEMVFREVDGLRSRLAEEIRMSPATIETINIGGTGSQPVPPAIATRDGQVENLSHRCSKELIELQARWNQQVDERLRATVETLIVHRTAALTEAAWRDSLTGLLNRAAFDERLREEFDRARRYDRQFSLVLLDVDRFKSVNDLHGHLAGDGALASIARIVQSSLRRSDAVFRYGGDEFAAICPETPKGAAAGVLQRLEINLRSWAGENRFAEQVGISWGIASFPDDVSAGTADARELIRVADQQLYLCKNVHHNRLAARP